MRNGHKFACLRQHGLQEPSHVNFWNHNWVFLRMLGWEVLKVASLPGAKRYTSLGFYSDDFEKYPLVWGKFCTPSPLGSLGFRAVVCQRAEAVCGAETGLHSRKAAAKECIRWQGKDT